MISLNTFTCHSPCSKLPKEEQTRASLALRIVACVVGILSTLTSLYFFFAISYASPIGWGAFSLGAFTLLSAGLFKCTKQKLIPDSPKPLSESSSSTSTQESSEIEVRLPPEPKLSPGQEKLLQTLGHELVDAFGGIDKVLAFPTFEWDGTVQSDGSFDVEKCTAPVMFCHTPKRLIVVVCYYRYSLVDKSWEKKAEVMFKDGNGWHPPYQSTVHELTLGCPNYIKEENPLNKYIQDKLARLVNSKSVGEIRRYKGVMIVKPKDKNTWRPTDAYLTDSDELDAFMDLDTLFYEVKPTTIPTHFVLCDPNKSFKENLQVFADINAEK